MNRLISDHRQSLQRHSRRGVLKRAAALGVGLLAGARMPARGSTVAAGVPTSSTRPDDDSLPAVALDGLDVPEPEIAEAYRQAARRNVLAAVNPKVFFGYFSVCADGQGFGYGNSYPSLDGHQLSDALLWLGQVEVVKANWDYVRSFQRPNGQLPLAILPGLKQVGGTPVDANGGFYKHWVPGDPLRALAGPTYIQNADVIFRHTQDRPWLAAQLPSINLAADFLAGLTSKEGLVAGAGYYMERPTRIEYDGVAQGHAADAFRRVGALNQLLGDTAAAQRYQELAERIAAHFRTRFWSKDHFAEYLHPQRGIIDRHGLNDVDWSALATGVAGPEQQAILWPRLKNEKKLYYGGMPTGIATQPETYEDWEFTQADRFDLAAMGRVWYLECWARARMNDAEGLMDTIRRVCAVGRADGYYWRERYVAEPKGGCQGRGAQKYCEYPANLIRIMQRFIFGVDLRLDGAVAIAPTVPASYWDAGFGQTLVWRGQRLRYRMQRGRIAGEFQGTRPQQLLIRLSRPSTTAEVLATIDHRPVNPTWKDDFLGLDLPPTKPHCPFEVRLNPG